MKRQIISLVVVFLWCVTSYAYQGFVKPVASASDYNGSYQGSPLTGSVRYTTLYRDNQDNGFRAGCRGEGCGRHPGVDIAVPSGTDVVSVLPGKVVISRCDKSWGGLVVVKSAHPQRAWENIYHLYAHLRSRQHSNGLDVVAGDNVQAGSLIGKSGGNRRSDPCSGSSTGSHLHFQIDKDDGNDEPYYPVNVSIQTRDDDFMVPTRTYNPMVLLQSGYRWSFQETGNRELWDLINWRSWGVSDGALWMDGDFDPHITRGGLTNCGGGNPCSADIYAESGDYKNIYLDLFNNCPTGFGKIYFKTSQENYWSEDKTIYYYSQGSGLYRGLVGAGWHPKWTGAITGLRIDPAEYCLPNYFDPTYYGEIGLVR